MNYPIAAIPANELKTGMSVLLPKEQSFKITKHDSPDTNISFEILEPYETVIIDNKYPFDCLISTMRTDGTAILTNLGTSESFLYSGKIIVPADSIVHSYMGNNRGGDLVVCNDRMTQMLVPQGTDLCPCCKSYFPYGCLDYPDFASDHVYATQYELASKGKIVIYHDRPENDFLYSSYV